MVDSDSDEEIQSLYRSINENKELRDDSTKGKQSINNLDSSENQESDEISDTDKLLYITYDDIPKTTDEGRPTKYHEPKYNLPIYCDPKFQNYGLRERMTLTCSFYTVISKNLQKLSKRSFLTAPLGHPIQSSAKFKDRLSKDNENVGRNTINLGEDNSLENVYISRSGRTTKRKCYAEESGQTKRQRHILEEQEKLVLVNKEPHISSLMNKKNNDGEDEIKCVVPSTKAKCKPIASSQASKDRLSRDDEQVKESGLISDDDSIEMAYVSRSGRVTKKRKLYKNYASPDVVESTKNATKTTVCASPASVSKENQKIINRSNLFKDANTPRSRVARMLREGEKQAAERENREKEKNVFVQSLDDVEHDDSSEENEIRLAFPATKTLSTIDEDEGDVEFYTETRRRVPPPIRKRTNVVAKDRVPKARPTISKTSKLTKKRDSSEDLSDEGPSTSVDDNRVQCPICSNRFPINEIEEHASSCGENQVETRSHINPITCNICDRVFISAADCEEHMEQCIQENSQ